MLLACVACRDAASGLRVYTYPPGFEYIPEERLASSMWMLAHEVSRLEDVLAEPEADPAARRADVVAILQHMDAAAARVDTPGRSTNHPVLSTHLAGFRERIQRARLAVERDPPSYLHASEVVGSCTVCHGPKAG